jgi:hypothetical protein
MYKDGAILYTDLDKLPDFERGILGILMGGLAPFEDGANVSTPYYFHHTLLDLLYRFESYAFPYPRDQGDFTHIINEQISALNSAWKDVVKGYAEYKKSVVPTPRNKTFGKAEPQKQSSKKR